MLINEIVVIEEDLVSKIKRFFRKDFEYDKSKLKSVKLNNVEYKWENGNYFLPNGDPVDQNGSLYQTLVLDPKNSAAWKNVTPAQATRLRKGLFKGTRTNIAKKVGMSGLGQQSRSNPKAGIGAKAGEWTGELIGKGIDSLAGVIANAIGGRKQKPGGGDDIDSVRHLLERHRRLPSLRLSRPSRVVVHGWLRLEPSLPLLLKKPAVASCRQRTHL